MQTHPMALMRLLVPVAIIGAALWLRIYIDNLGTETRVVLTYLPYLLCLTALFLAYQFNRCRLMLATLGLGVFYWLLQSQLQVSLSQPEAARLYLATSLAVPLLCLYLLLVPETGIWHLQGCIVALVFLFLALASSQLAAWLPQTSEAAAGYYRARPSGGYILSHGATLLMALVLVAGLVLVFLRDDETDIALLGALVTLYLTLALLHLEDISIVMSVAGGLCLVWGLLRSTHAMAYRDELTGLLGRRALTERLNRLGRRYCIAMLDVDHFKQFNDKHGHDIGDEVLRMVSARINRVGSGGTAYRYGGEEFCVVFPRKSVEEAAAALEAVRTQISDYRMSIRDRDRRPVRSRDGARRRGATRLGSSQVAVTISAGLAERSEDFPRPDEVVMNADKMLYRAKKAGRNRVVY
ncbi:MAG: GGDEF domain-containing protein [Pseudomonadales bacterium]|nr:GGDEF domain-containing protein [Halioglobus sp.]MCP5123995.1 GGDEF domain-containing protein [Pseudomonadales bacterium]MCP5194075.1 GGDEF domain-containing protein [Pseudomonadales bacterium]